MPKAAVIGSRVGKRHNVPRIFVKHRLPGRFRVVVERASSVAQISWSALTAALASLPDVDGVRLNTTTNSLVVHYRGDQEETEGRILSCIRSGVAHEPLLEDPHRPSEGTVVEATERSATRSLQIASLAIPLGIASFPLTAPLFWACIAYSAWPSMHRAVGVLVRERRLNVDFQDTVSIALSMVARQNVAAAIMTWLIALGDTIRERTGLRSKRAVEGMLNFQDSLCWVVRKAGKIRLPVNEVRAGDCVVIYHGEMIPVDGTVLKGTATVDQKAITGESQPVARQRHEPVFAGTVLQEGQLYVRTVHHGEATVVARIVRAVAAAPLGETRAQNYAERVADKLVAPNLALSGGLYAFSSNIERFLSMMIVDYGTGIRVSAPTAVLASMTDAARRGILIKSGGIIERLAQVDTVVFDKTGTITRGEPVVSEVISYSSRAFPGRRLIALAAAAEARLNHPAAHALARLAKQHGIKPMKRQSCKFKVGLGVHSRVDEHEVLIGSARFLESQSVKLDSAAADLSRCDEKGNARLLIAIDGRLVGLFVLEDQVRPEMQAVVNQLRHRGIRHIMMLTGDNARVAAHVARGIGVSEFVSDVMPEEKAEVVRKLKASGRTVAMVGDGVNDSVALALADVGISMRHGADITREAADVVLMEDHMGKLVVAIDVSRQATKLIKQNIFIVTGLNTLALALSIPEGLVSPATTALVSNGSAILASINSMRPVMKY